MGVRLVAEVMNHYRGPDHKRSWLVALALSARDDTREGWPGRDILSWRTEKSGTRVSNIAAELVSEKVVERAGGGGRNRGNAGYRILPIAVPDGCPCFACHPERKPSRGARRTHSDRDSQGSRRARKFLRSRRSRL